MQPGAKNIIVHYHIWEFTTQELFIKIVTCGLAQHKYQISYT